MGAMPPGAPAIILDAYEHQTQQDVQMQRMADLSPGVFLSALLVLQAASALSRSALGYACFDLLVYGCSHLNNTRVYDAV